MNKTIDLKAEMHRQDEWVVWVDGFRNIFIEDGPYGFPVNVGTAQAGGDLPELVKNVCNRWLKTLDRAGQLHDGDMFTININSDSVDLQFEIDKEFRSGTTLGVAIGPEQ